MKIQIFSDLENCERIWKETIPERDIFDSWEFRKCFHNNFERPPHFIVSEKNGEINGFLPLSYIEEEKYYGYFPGETWKGKTWLEGNKMISKEPKVTKEIFNYLIKNKMDYHLKYLMPSQLMKPKKVDEIGYLFFPKKFNHEIENYFKVFSHKSRQHLKKELSKLESKGIEFRFDSLKDFNLLVRWNIQRYGENSYFWDKRFFNSFKEVLNLLNEKKFLRLTTLIIKGEPAAVDIGCLFKNNYTVFGGGTNEKFPGVAKFINIHHMSKACNEKINKVDFLCGDFSWKKLFHLTPRPLYLLSNKN